MVTALDENKYYAERLKTVLRLRYEPVACKLIKPGEEFPAGCKKPSDQLSHCQAVFRAKDGECFALTAADESCHVGTSVLGMTPTPEKVATGQFHGGMGIFDSVEAAKEMIDKRYIVTDKMAGEAICPLKDADFIPDVVILIDIAERIYWVVPLEVAAKGGRVDFTTAPYQCCCEDTMAIPIIADKPNLSIGCFGCRKRTDIKAEEMVMGFPFNRIKDYVEHLNKYETGVMTKSKRD